MQSTGTSVANLEHFDADLLIQSWTLLIGLMQIRIHGSDKKKEEEKVTKLVIQIHIMDPDSALHSVHCDTDPVP